MTRILYSRAALAGVCALLVTIGGPAWSAKDPNPPDPLTPKKDLPRFEPDPEAFDSGIRPGGSAEVLFSFPSNVEQLSVDPSGALSAGLMVPTFPAALQPQIVASYNSRGGDGVMGTGWNIHVPAVTLDLSRGAAPMSTAPTANYVLDDSGRQVIRDRWIAHPGGKLVCEPDPHAPGWYHSRCVTDPRGPVRFYPQGDAFTYSEASFVGVDPNEGVVQEFGPSLASQIVDEHERPVAWLIERERTRWGDVHGGGEVVHFYEELPDTHQRLRVATLMGGNKVVRFVYEPREHVRVDYALGVERRQGHLLTQIRLLKDCVPVQLIHGPNHVETDFSSCNDVNPDGAVGADTHRLEVIDLDYQDHYERLSGHYVLSSWTHRAGDWSATYNAVELVYNGDLYAPDGASLPDVETERVQDTTDQLWIPEGFSLGTHASYVPFQNYMDFDGDGLADWIHRKDDSWRYWPEPLTADHKLYVELQTGGGGFYDDRSYPEPMVDQAIWLGRNGSDYKVPHFDQVTDDTGITFGPPFLPLVVAPTDVETVAGIQGWPADPVTSMATANIAIDTWPFLQNDALLSIHDDPIFDGLTMSVECAQLGTELCDEITWSYACIWEGDCEYGELESGWTRLSVKLADYMDIDGDGDLDRVISGLLVVWEASNPTVWRDPLTDDPAIFVSRFDRDSDSFQPFERYDIDPPSGDFAELTPAFLSALSVEKKHNNDSSPGDMSAQSAVSAATTAIGVSMQLLGLPDTLNVLAENASTTPFASGKGVLAAGQFILSTMNMGLRAAGASPEQTQLLGTLGTVASVLDRGLTIATSLSVVLSDNATRAAMDASGLGKTAVITGGWAAIGGAVVGIIGTGVGVAFAAVAKKRMQAPGYNPAAVAANAKLTQAIISISTTAVATIFATWAAAVAASGPAAIVTAIVGGLISIGIAIYSLLTPDGSIAWEEGTAKYKNKPKRGLRWLPGSDQDQFWRDSGLCSSWMDIDGDRRPDLVIGKYDPSGPGFAVALGARDPEEGPLATAAFEPWTFGATPDPPHFLNESMTHTQLELKHVHRADLTRITVATMDINGDGRVDLVEADPGAGHTSYSPFVYLNTGRGFATGVEWEIPDDGASAPSGCTGIARPNIARNRSLSWLESVSSTEGYSVALSNVTQMIGPDINSDGLPDLVIKDELSYPTMIPDDECTTISTALTAYLLELTCDLPLPVVGEPGWPGGSEPCQDVATASDLWFANFDGFNVTDGYREGVSHLTEAAEQVFSPRHEGTHYVAYNTGSGFTRFEPLDRELPSFGGSFSVQDITNPASAGAELALSGTSNFLADVTGKGQSDLIAIDIHDKKVDNISSPRPDHLRYRLGVANPAALREIRYPEGGVARIDYALEHQVNGQQGPPLWVVSRTEFDDRVEVGQFGGQLPFVEYSYTGGLMQDGEFRGFEAIGETRWSGDHVTQLVHAFHQHGPERGLPYCTEVRGSTLWHGESLYGEVEQPGCDPEVLATRPKGEPWPADQENPGPSCFDDIAALHFPAVYPLQRSTVITYDTSETLLTDAGEELLRDTVMSRQVTTTHNNNASEGAWMQLDVTWSPPPARTPVASTLTTDDGLERTLETDWLHVDAGEQWAFLKVAERQVAPGASSPWLETTYTRNAAAPWELLELAQCDAAGTCRGRTFGYVGSEDGQATAITDAAGQTTTYTYYDDFEDGTGRVESVTRPTDAFKTATAAETWTYDPLGRPLTHTDPRGVETSWTYDGLGVLASERLPGQVERTYSYADIGAPGWLSDAGSLLSQQRTMRVQTVGGQRRETFTWWDGFYRKHREGLRVDGVRSLALDFDGDGQADMDVEIDPNDGFPEQAEYLLTDFRLNALRVQCTSTPYLDTGSPAGWDTELVEALGRRTYKADRAGYREWTTRTLSPAAGGEPPRLKEKTVSDLAGLWITREQDAIGRALTEQHSGLQRFDYTHDTWDNLVSQIDLRGFETRMEVNAWGQLTARCTQPDSASAGVGTLCPTGWPTTRTEYDALGRVTSVTDPEGHRLDMTPSLCNEPGRVDYPDEGGGPSSLTWTFDAGCKPASRAERNGSLTTFEYDSAGRPSALTAAAGTPEAARVEMGYDGVGRSLWRSDPNGFRHYSLHDWRGLRSHAWEAADATLGEIHERRWYYDTLGFLEAYVDAEGFKRSFEHDREGRRTSESWEDEICDAGALAAGVFGAVNDLLERTWDYDVKGRLVGTTDEGGNRREMKYDALDRLTLEYATDLAAGGLIDPAVYREWTFDGDALVAFRDFEGWSTFYTVDGLGRRTAVEQEHDGVTLLRTAFEYDGNGNITRVLPPNEHAGSACVTGANGAGAGANHTTEYTWTALNQLATVTGPEDQFGNRHTEVRHYDHAGQLVGVDLPGGRSWSFELDGLGRVWRTTRPDGTTTEQSFDAAGQVIAQLDPRGLVTTHSYDALGRRVETVPPSGHPTAWTWTPEGRVELVVTQHDTGSAFYEGVHRAYTVGGQLAAESWARVDASLGTTLTNLRRQTCVNRRGLPRAEADANGNLRRNGYDNRGRRVRRQLPGLGGAPPAETTYAYDDEHRLTFVEAPMSTPLAPTVTTTYTWDGAGRKLSESFSQAATVRTFEYDANGNICRAYDLDAGAIERPIDYTYDARGLETARAGDASVSATFEWDAAGRRVLADDATGTWVMTWDAMDQLVQQSQTVDLIGMTFDTVMTYGPDGRLETLEYPAVPGFAGPTSQTFQVSAADGRMELVYTDLGDVAAGMAWDGPGRLRSYTMGNGASWSSSFSSWGRLQDVEVYDPAGAPVVSYSYSYDLAGNLTELANNLAPAYSLTAIGYDERNRMEAFSAGAIGGAVTFEYNDQNLPDVVSTVAGSSFYSYDAFGNLMAKAPPAGPAKSYSYDDYGNRESEWDALSSQDFVYDDQNRLVATIGSGGGAKSFEYAWDNRRVREGTKLYLYGPGRLPLVELETTAGSLTDARFNIYVNDELAQCVDGATGDVTTYALNHQGSPVAEMDALGAVVDQHAYGPYGRALGALTPVTDAIGFQGNFHESATGFVLMHNRHYDPSTLSFVSGDPIGLAGGNERYDFVNASPLMATDRSGLMEEPDFIQLTPIEIEVIGYHTSTQLLGVGAYFAAGILDGASGLLSLPEMGVRMRDWAGRQSSLIAAYNQVDPSYWLLKGAAAAANPALDTMSNAKEGYYAFGEYAGIDRKSDVAFIAESAGYVTGMALEGIATGGLANAARGARVGAGAARGVSSLADDTAAAGAGMLDDVVRAGGSGTTVADDAARVAVAADEPVAVASQTVDGAAAAVTEDVAMHSATLPGAPRLKTPNARSQSVGATPSKKSSVGKEVIERMRREGTVKGPEDAPVFLGDDGVWRPVHTKDTHMGHIEDAVTHWNAEGYMTGARSPEVRGFMKRSSNYRLEHGPLNSRNGANLDETYRLPDPDAAMSDDEWLLRAAWFEDGYGWDAPIDF